MWHEEEDSVKFLSFLLILWAEWSIFVAAECAAPASVFYKSALFRYLDTLAGAVSDFQTNGWLICPFIS